MLAKIWAAKSKYCIGFSHFYSIGNFRVARYRTFGNAGNTEAMGKNHRVDREDITIISLDTKLVPDFVLHACCFFIAGNRPVLIPLNRTNKRLSYENRAAKS